MGTSLQIEELREMRHDGRDALTDLSRLSTLKTAAYPAYLFLYNTHMRKGTFQGKKHAGRYVVPIRAAERLGKNSSCPS